MTGLELESESDSGLRAERSPVESESESSWSSGEIQVCMRLLSIRTRLKAAAVSGQGLAGEEDSHSPEALASSSQDVGIGIAAKENVAKPLALALLESLYRDHPGPVWRAASRNAVGKVENGKYLIYGEVSFVAFARLVHQFVDLGKRNGVNGECHPGFTFYDLGCGSGRPVFMTALLSAHCGKACGIEIVPGIHQMNRELLRLFDLEVRPLLHPRKQKQEISFLQGDFLKIDWSDADIIFTNATCFEDPLFQNLENLATQVLRPGALVISVTRHFTGSSWELLDKQERRMSWASAFVYVQRKKASS